MNNKARVLLGGDYLMTFGTGMLGPIFAVFTQKIGGDILDISWAWAAYLITTGVFMFFIGKFSDFSNKKFVKEKFVVVGFGFQSILTFGYLLVSTPLQLLFLQIALGLANAMSFPTWDALYARYENKQKDGLSWGLVDGGEQFLTGIAMLIGGLIVSYFSFAALFITMGLLQISATIYQIKLLKK